MQTIKTELQIQPAEKPLTEWEQIVLKLIDGELEVVEHTEYALHFKYNNNEYSIWTYITSRNALSFGSLHTVNNRMPDDIIKDKTKIRPEIQEKLKVCGKITDYHILQKFEQEHFKL